MAINRQKIIAAAQKHIQRGSFKRAIREYRRILTVEPENVRVLLKIGDIQARDGQTSAAAATYQEVADHYVARGFFLKAVAVYKTLLRLQPDRVDVSVHLADLYFQLSLLSDALNYLRVAAKQYQQRNDTASFIQTWERIVALDPDRIGNRIKLAEQYSLLKNVEKAAEHFLIVCERLYSDKRFEDFIKVVERYLFHKPTDVEMIKRLARLRFDRGEYKIALSRIKTVFPINSNDLEAVNILFDSLQAIGEKEKGLEVLRDLVRSYDLSGAHKERDAIKEKLKKLGVRSRTRPPKMPPLPKTPLSNKARKAKIKQYLSDCDVFFTKFSLTKKAIASLDKALSLEPNNLEVIHYRVRIILHTGSEKDAFKYLTETAKKLREDYPSTTTKLLQEAEKYRPAEIPPNITTELLPSEILESVSGNFERIASDAHIPIPDDSILELEEDDVGFSIHDALFEVENDFNLDEEFGSLFSGLEEGTKALDNDPDLITQIGDPNMVGLLAHTDNEEWTSDSWSQVGNKTEKKRPQQANENDLFITDESVNDETKPPSKSSQNPSMPKGMEDDMKFIDFQIAQGNFEEAGYSIEDIFEEYDSSLHFYAQAKLKELKKLQQKPISGSYTQQFPGGAATREEIDAPVGSSSSSMKTIFSYSEQILKEFPQSELAIAIRQRMDGNGLMAMSTLQEEMNGKFSTAATFEFAVCYMGMGLYYDTTTMLESLSKKIKFSKKDQQLIFYYLGIAYEALNQMKKAKGAFLIIKSDPKFPDVQQRLTRIEKG